MKNPKNPSLEQKKIIHGRTGENPEDFLVVKNIVHHMEIVSKADFEKFGSKARTKVIDY